MIPAWFADKLDFQPLAPALPGRRGAGRSGRASRTCASGRRRTSATSCRAGRRASSSWTIRTGASTRPAARCASGRGSSGSWRRKGYNVATWRDDEIVYSLVSDLDEAALYELVRTAQAR